VDLASRTYGDLGINADFITSGQLEKHGTIKEHYDSHNKVIYMDISVFGMDTPAVMKEVIEKRSHENIAAEKIFLGISHPSSINGFECLRGEKYQFSGFDLLGRQPCIMFYKSSNDLAEIKLTERLAALRDEVNLI